MERTKSNISFLLCFTLGALNFIFFSLEYNGFNLYRFMVDGWGTGSIWYILLAIGAILSIIAAASLLVVGSVGFIKTYYGKDVSDNLIKCAKILILITSALSIVLLIFVILFGAIPEYNTFRLGAGVIICAILGIGFFIVDKMLENFSFVIKQCAFVDDRFDYTVSDYKPSKVFKGIFDILEAFVYAIIAVLFIFTFFARLTIVQGESMEGTLHNGDFLVVTNIFFSYEPENGDIVVIHGDFANYISSKNDNKYDVHPTYSDPIVKRVIATGGQTIKINFVTSEVFVDGVELDEEYRRDKFMLPFLDPNDFLRQFTVDENGNYTTGDICYDPSNFVLTATVPEDHIFVMGDNRNNSADSRHRDIGFVPNEFVIGKAVFRLSPFTVF